MISSRKVIIALSGLLLGAAGRHAQANCDTSSVSGQYAFKATGAIVGVFDTASPPTIHSLASPQLINAIGQATFDGNGSYTRVDFAVQNGVPVPSPLPLSDDGFRTGLTGSYAVDPDCTGTMTLSFGTGQINGFAIAVADYGQRVLGEVSSSMHLPSLPAAVVPSGTSCDSGCDIGVNLTIELTKNSNRRR